MMQKIVKLSTAKYVKAKFLTFYFPKQKCSAFIFGIFGFQKFVGVESKKINLGFTGNYLINSLCTSRGSF
jgi:hypothetical protein